MWRSSSRKQREDGKKSRLISGNEQQNMKQHNKACITKFPNNDYCSELAVPICKKSEHCWVNVLNKAQVKSALLQHPWGKCFGIPGSLNADGGAEPCWSEALNQPPRLQWKWFPPKLNIDFWIKILTFLLQMCRISLWPKTMKSRACTVNLLIQWCQNSSWSRGCCSYWRLSKRELLRRTPCKCRCR